MSFAQQARLGQADRSEGRATAHPYSRPHFQSHLAANPLPQLVETTTRENAPTSQHAATKTHRKLLKTRLDCIPTSQQAPMLLKKRRRPARTAPVSLRLSTSSLLDSFLFFPYVSPLDRNEYNGRINDLSRFPVGHYRPKSTLRLSFSFPPRGAWGSRHSPLATRHSPLVTHHSPLALPLFRA